MSNIFVLNLGTSTTLVSCVRKSQRTQKQKERYLSPITRSVTKLWPFEIHLSIAVVW